MSKKKRKYQDNYLDFGFTYLIQDGLQISQCVLWIKTFSNCTMKPAPLKQHLANAHPSTISKNWSFFELKLSSLKRQKLDRTGMFWQFNNAAIHASFAIALHVAKAKKTQTIGKTLLKPCIVLESVKLMLGEKASQTMKQISLSNDTTKLLIHEMSENIKSKVISNINSSVFALQLDETTDLSNFSATCVYQICCR